MNPDMAKCSSVRDNSCTNHIHLVLTFLFMNLNNEI